MTEPQSLVEQKLQKLRQLRALQKLKEERGLQPDHRWSTPGQMAQALDPTTLQTPALDVIDNALEQVAQGKITRLIISMPPQEGKSQRVSRRFPLWLLHQDKRLRIAIASYEHRMARRWGRAIRDDLRIHGPRLRMQVSTSSFAAHEWQLEGKGGGVYCVGIGGALTGRPVDVLIIDDPIKDRKQADSLTHREAIWDWWTDVALTRLAPGAPVVIILTRWHFDDIVGRLLAAEDGDDWTVINIPAEADHDPAKGGTDPLGREPGEFMESARRRTPADWQLKKTAVGARTWASLYQGRPSPAQGDIFERDWWQFYDSVPWIQRSDGSMWVPPVGEGDPVELIQSWDMAFKGTEDSDFVVGQVWLRRGVQAFLLDQVCERLTFTRTCQALRELTARWPQAVLKLVEDKANGTAVINSLSRTVGGIVPEEPHGSKQARAAAVSPFVQAGNVFLPAPELAPWIGRYLEELTSFPNAAHDDQVDATSQALNRLLLAPLLTEVGIIEDETYDEYDISPY